MAAEVEKTPFWRRRRGRFLLILGAIVLVALLLRLAVSSQLLEGYWAVRNPARDTDTGHYQYLAKQILDGTYDYSQGFYFQPFYYAVCLPAVYTIFGRGPWGVIIVQTVLGAALFARQSKKHLAELRNMVTSPGGTSADAIYQLEKGSLRTILSKAIWAAYQKSLLLGEQNNIRSPERELPLDES